MTGHLHGKTTYKIQAYTVFVGLIQPNLRIHVYFTKPPPPFEMQHHEGIDSHPPCSFLLLASI